MNPFLIAILQTLEPVALEALQAALGEVSKHLNHAMDTHPGAKK